MYINTIAAIDDGAFCSLVIVKTYTEMTVCQAAALMRERGFSWAAEENIRLISILDNDLSVTERTASATVEFSIEDILDIIVPGGDYHYGDISVRDLVRAEAIGRAAHSMAPSVILTLSEGDVNVVATVEWMM